MVVKQIMVVGLGLLMLVLQGCGPALQEDSDDIGETEAPLRVPGNGFGLDEQICLASPGANTLEGRVHNRFLWCQRAGVGAVARDARTRREVGRVELDYEAVAYGRDDGRREITVLFRGIGARYFDDLTPEDSLSVGIDCDDVGEVFGISTTCRVIDPPETATFFFWETNRVWQQWVISSDDTDVTSFDKVARHTFGFTFNAISATAGTDAIEATQHTIRCDSAPYFRGRSKACIFDDVLPHLQYSVADPRVAGVAEHINQAFTNPSSTWPEFGSNKNIPGKYTGSRTNGLRRVDYKGPIWQTNQLEKDRACQGRAPYQTTGLPPDKYMPSFQDCDEYPFASTAEGAGSAAYDFSVLGVDRSQNRCAGNALKSYYGGDRILYYNDPFWVEITDVPLNGDQNFCAVPLDDEPSDDDETGVPVGFFPAPIRDDPPSVSAGIDQAGDEGRSIQLGGSASDLESAVSVQWSYRAISDVDPGTTCSFSNPHSVRTRFTCTDDGTFEVTLTAQDDINAPVSDSAIVTLQNVAPTLHLNGPDPWQLFQIDQAVPLDATFDDAPNDTHTCVVDWDDGTVETYAAATHDCSRPHTFTHPGMFTIGITVTDDDGASAHGEVLVIAHDPNGPSSTSDGSIDSTAGSLVAQPSFAGEEWYHLTARYYGRGQTIPIGNAQTWLPGTNFRFDSANDPLEWLVVTPDGKIAVKGTGSLQGASGRYGFVFYGYVGCQRGAQPCQAGADRFRIVVWNLDSGRFPGANVVYDSRAGANYDLDKAEPQALRSGIVMILPLP